jgi:hypothetical protein
MPTNRFAVLSPPTDPPAVATEAPEPAADVWTVQALTIVPFPDRLVILRNGPIEGRDQANEAALMLLQKPQVLHVQIMPAE